ncbi:DEKNAAC104442 [Brettanomyces naardenensis]|uniref:DEKNAAC104442 n=1 Tax=Brettanomyces naardenensis TaxID=13370 RepID=A0A448YQU2_BRENA|nr:DEKNAAC104442 [Brettanomyces naardenensis]
MGKTEKWDNPKDRFFTHNGYPDQAPNHVKKDGFGKGNWGKPGDEVQDMINDGDLSDKIMHKQRRGSNTSSNEDKFANVQMQSVVE